MLILAVMRAPTQERVDYSAAAFAWCGWGMRNARCNCLFYSSILNTKMVSREHRADLLFYPHLWQAQNGATGRDLA